MVPSSRKVLGGSWVKVGGLNIMFIVDVHSLILLNFHDHIILFFFQDSNLALA